MNDLADRFETMNHLPLIDLSRPMPEVAQRIGAACRAHGFFYVVGHGIDEALGLRLEALSRRFFAMPDSIKANYAMALGGRAWRGWFPLGGELTSGRPDWKEGLYLGTELPDEHPRVRAGVPLHGRNLLPGDDVLPGFRETVLDYMAAVTRARPPGDARHRALARSAGRLFRASLTRPTR